MANIISDETIEYVGILAKLELSPEEKEQAKKDMGNMLDYIDMLNGLDTEGAEPCPTYFRYTTYSVRMWSPTETDTMQHWLMHRHKKTMHSKYRRR